MTPGEQKAREVLRERAKRLRMEQPCTARYSSAYAVRPGTGKRGKALRTRYRRKDPEKVLELVREVVLARRAKMQLWITAEGVSFETRTRTEQVRQALHKLNLEGIIGQKLDIAPHDSPRDMLFGGSDSAWKASVYDIIPEVPEP